MFGGDTDNKVAVSITMSDGTVINGKVDGGPTKNISTVLNRDGDFVEVILEGSRTQQLSKRFIMAMEPLEQAVKPNLVQRVNDDTDPYKVLKVSQDADAATLKAAYIQLCRQYHPDSYAGADVPEELNTYVNQMFKLVNSAYRQVSKRAA